MPSLYYGTRSQLQRPPLTADYLQAPDYISAGPQKRKAGCGLNCAERSAADLARDTLTPRLPPNAGYWMRRPRQTADRGA